MLWKKTWIHMDPWSWAYSHRTQVLIISSRPGIPTPCLFMSSRQPARNVSWSIWCRWTKPSSTLGGSGRKSRVSYRRVMTFCSATQCECSTFPPPPSPSFFARAREPNCR